jgi:hypothetical protein
MSILRPPSPPPFRFSVLTNSIASFRVPGPIHHLQDPTTPSGTNVAGVIAPLEKKESLKLGPRRDGWLPVLVPGSPFRASGYG